jgi:hypothetical protein
MKPLAAWAGSITAVCIALGGAWAAMDYLGIRPVLSRELASVEERVAANQQGMMLIRWQILNQKRQRQALSPSELFEFCKLSKALGFRVPECR